MPAPYCDAPRPPCPRPPPCPMPMSCPCPAPTVWGWCTPSRAFCSNMAATSKKPRSTTTTPRACSSCACGLPARCMTRPASNTGSAPPPPPLRGRWGLLRGAEPVRTVLLVSKEGHCLNDLLFRWQSGLLPVDIRAIISNHRDFCPLAASYAVPFPHLPVSAATKAQAEARLLEIIEAEGAELVVLARYMQVLSDALCRQLAGRVINIHHSFLPSFKGAKPYHQAHERGVKLIGATAHYVTADLDEGPIIEQDVARAEHTDTVETLIARGRDTESQVLARAVKWHSEHRVLLDGHKTVVFR